MINNLKKNEAALVVGGKGCLTETIDDGLEKLVMGIGIFYCINNGEENFLNKLDRFTNSIAATGRLGKAGKEGIKQVFCYTPFITLLEIKKYLLGDWIKCSK